MEKLVRYHSGSLLSRALTQLRQAGINQRAESKEVVDKLIYEQQMLLWPQYSK